jgi:hypothetical protein
MVMRAWTPLSVDGEPPFVGDQEYNTNHNHHPNT